MIPVKLSIDNGGIATDITENGLGLALAMPLCPINLFSLRIRLPGLDSEIETSAQVVWRSESKRRAGVRFVELSENVRRQIEDWIASESTCDPLPTTGNVALPATKTPDETEKLRTITPAGDRATAALEGKQEGGRADDAPVARSDMQHPVTRLEPPRIQNTATSQDAEHYSYDGPDRRLHVRRRIQSLAYVEWTGKNGGVALDLGEGGMALVSALPLTSDELRNLRFHLPDTTEHVELSGQVAWKSKSGKRAGLKFVGLTEDERQRIRDWVSGETSSDRVHPLLTSGARTPLEAWAHVIWRSESKRRAGVRFVELSENVRRQIEDWIASESTCDPLPTTGNVALPATKAPDETEKLRTITPAGDRATAALEGKQESGRADDAPVARSDVQHPVTRLEPPRIQNTTTSQDAEHYSYDGPDRRLHVRRRIQSLAYVEWTGKNGGVALDLGEGGMALVSALPLAGDAFRNVRLQFPDTGDRIDVHVQVAWKSKSGKRAGVKFVGLTEDLQRRIRDWVSGELISEQVQTPKERSERKPGRRESMDMILAAGTPSSATSRVMQLPGATASLAHARVPGIPAGLAYKQTPRPRSSQAFAVNKRSLIEELLAVRVLERFATKAAAVILLAAVLSFAIGWATARFPIRNAMMRFAGSTSAPSKSAGPTMLSTGTKDVTVSDAASAVVDQLPPRTDQVHLETKLSIAPIASTAPETLLAKASDQESRIVTPHAADQSRPEFQSARIEPLPGDPAANRTPSSAVRVDRPTPKVEREVPLGILHGMQARNAVQQRNEIENPPPLGSVSTPPDSPLLADHKYEASSLAPPRQETPVNLTGSVVVVADRYPSIRISLEPGAKKSRVGERLQLGHLSSRVEPVYPIRAKEDGIEGAVEMHAIIGPDGSVVDLVSVNGPPLLVPAAVNAVRQWRYTETLVAGRPVETEQDISVKFRLSKSGTTE